MLREDARVTYTDTEASLRVESGRVAKILHVYLRVARCHLAGCHSFTDSQKVTQVELLLWNASEIQQWELLPWFWDHYRWRDLDLSVWSRNKRHSSVRGFPNVDRPVKVKRAKSVGKKTVLTFFAAGAHGQQYHLSFKGQWLQSGTPQLPSHRFSKNCEKSAQELDWAASYCTVTMPLPMPPIWQWILWGASCAAVVPSSLQSRPGIRVTSFCSLRWRPDCVGSGFQHLKTWLQHTKGSPVHWMTVTGASAANRGSGGCDVA